MTAPFASTASVYNGIREYGLVTNTFGGYITSAGAAYTLQTPFQADKFEWTNYTSFATTMSPAQGVWYRDYPAAAASVLIVGTSPALNVSKNTTTGVTIANTGPGFATEQYPILTTGILAGVVTTNAACISAMRTTSPYTRVIITQVVGTVASGVNNQTFVAVPLTATTFQLYDVYGLPVVPAGSWSSAGQITITGPDLGIVNAPKLYYLTLGVSVMGAANDVIYFQATKMNNYQNFGTA